MTYPYGCANIDDFAYFITNVMQVPADALASPVQSDPSVQVAFAVAKCTVDTLILRVSPIYYNLAMYNFGGDYLVNNAIDPACSTYWASLRKDMDLTGPISGVVQSTADVTTSTSLAVPEQLKDFSLFDLQMFKTPWGRAYMAIAQKFGDIWGALVITLVLGVVDIPYADRDEGPKKVAQAKRGKANKPVKEPKGSSPVTTGEVAQHLEDRYHIMKTFAVTHKDSLERELLKSLQGAIVNLNLGMPPRVEPFAEGFESLQQEFREFLDQRDMESLGFPGVPTQAALRGVNHRLKDPYAAGNPRRPSFIDTGLYQATFKMWSEK